MFKDNTKQVNSIIAKAFLGTSVILVIMIITSLIGIFDFDDLLIISIIGGIFFVGFMPSLLIKLKAPDSILKYYMMLSLSVFIGLMGTNNNVGIYITYVLVPIVSCLYFDKKFTIRVSNFSYVTMAIGVYFNCAGKAEVIYENWSHLITFRNYMLGFTFEYIVAMTFLVLLVKRAQMFLEAQQESLRILKEENDQQKSLALVYRNTLEDQKNSALSILSNDLESLTPESNLKLSAGNRFIVSLQDVLMYSDNTNRGFKQALSLLGDYFSLDRIMFIELLPSEGKSKLTLQWNKDPANRLEDYYPEMSVEEQKQIASIYKKKGYIELLPNQTYESKVGFTDYMISVRLGSQLWMPAIVNGEYMGAMCFDRIKDEGFNIVEKFLLAEVAGIVATNITRLNSENANHAKSNFLSSMSHEIRTPMNAIMGMTTVALREDNNPTVKKCLNVIRSSSEGLLTIINDILDFSKIEAGKIEIIPQDYQLLSLLNDVMVMANARNIEKGLVINYEVPDDLPSIINGDFVRIKQVMVNLVTNAIKYTDDGDITVRISCTPRDAETTILRYEVSDTGQGIREEDIDKLFISYSQVNQEKNRYTEGTGLGLTIAKQLVELMDGTIEVESTYGVGSCFSFDLPQRIVDASPAGKIEDFEYQNENTTEVNEFTAAGARVLIVDDNDMNLMIEEALFEPFEMDITTAESGAEVFELIKHNEYDLIFMDHFMPEMDGTDVARAIRALDGNPNQYIPIVALTADAVTGVKEEMLAAGMDDFLSKPIDLEQAVKVLRKFLPDKCN